MFLLRSWHTALVPKREMRRKIMYRIDQVQIGFLKNLRSFLNTSVIYCDGSDKRQQRSSTVCSLIINHNKLHKDAKLLPFRNK